MTTPKILIACKIFYDELQSVLFSRPDLKVVWIDAALHANLDRLEEKLKTALAQAAAGGAEVQILLGVGCHPDIVKLAGEYGAQLAPVRNCIEAFLGVRHKELEKNGTMIMTPGWIRAWPDIMASLGWDEVDVRQNMGRYNRILLLEPGINPLTDEEILAFFDLIQVPIDIEPLNLTNFQDLLGNMLG
jgi:hypothetical protein